MKIWTRINDVITQHHHQGGVTLDSSIVRPFTMARQLEHQRQYVINGDVKFKRGVR